MIPHHNIFASVCSSWEPEPVPLPWYQKIKAGWVKRRQEAKERREEPKVRAERLTHPEKARRKERQRWRFLDADGEEFEGPSLDDYFTPSDEGQILTEDVFARMKIIVEMRNRDIEESSGTLPIVRIGLLVPESKARALVKKRDEIFS
jgi:hypothetical protein